MITRALILAAALALTACATCREHKVVCTAAGVFVVGAVAACAGSTTVGSRPRFCTHAEPMPSTWPLALNLIGAPSIILLVMFVGADKRPERIEVMVTMPGGGSKKLTASYADYRTGEKPDAGFGLAEGKEALDKYHSGTYWPSRVTHELDGMKVLDLTITEGWANPYVVFPDPELLAKAQ